MWFPITVGDIAQRFKKMLDIFDVMTTIHSERRNWNGESSRENKGHKCL